MTVKLTLRKAFLLAGLMLFSFSISLAQNVYWNDVIERSIQAKGKREIIPEKYRTIELNKNAFQRQLRIASKENAQPFRRNSTIIDLPMPDGSFQQFTIVESPIVEEGLLRKYPNLKTYLGRGIDDPSSMVRFDFLESGLHAMIKSKEGITFIDPYSQNDTERYITYHVNDHHTNKEFVCNYSDQHLAKARGNFLHENRNSGNPVGDQLKILRIAIACTIEYSDYHLNAGRNPLDAIVTTLNRVNVLYETEVATRMILVNNNDLIVYKDEVNDPVDTSLDSYTNDDLEAMLAENVTTLENKIGKTNYDLGHVFGTKGGGLAGINVVCFSSKEWGATGISQPVGDFFDVVYVGHEIGHQFGAPHSWNSCQGESGSPTAYEPGSGSSIMGYAGLCGSDNVSNNTDYFFHSGSYDRIVNGGSSCATYQATGNNPPVVSITSPIGITIPKSTPFTLSGNATDADGHDLIYSWDQMDLGPVSDLGSPTGTAPLFRYRAPTSSPERTFPQMSDVVNNTSSISEVLPTTSRAINFRLVARDQQLGGGGVDYEEYNMNATNAAGPFLVQSPNTALTWLVGAMESVTWDVANTDSAPVNCTNVNILLSTDGGYTYPIVLASNVPNSGSAVITVPDNEGGNNRIKVEAMGNVFFDISNTNFTIEKPLTPTFTMTAQPNTIDLCGFTDAVYELNLTALAGFNEQVTLSSSGIPASVNVDFSNNPTTPPSTVNITLSNLTSVPSGNYIINVTGTSASQTVSIDVTLNLVSGTPNNAPTLQTPANNTSNINITPSFSWSEQTDATSYALEIATSPAFGNNTIISTEVENNNYASSVLNLLSVYYWRVRAKNACGYGAYSEIYSFQTNDPGCISYSANDLPINIEIENPNTITSSLNVPHSVIITDVNITKLKGTHTYVEDLSFILKSPGNVERTLLRNACGEADDFDIGFDESSTETSIICPITNQSIYKAQESLSIYNGSNSQGDWILTVADAFQADGGALEEWTLEICHEAVTTSEINIVNNNLLSTNKGTTTTIENTLLQSTHSSSTAAEISYMIISTSVNGSINLNGTTLEIGDTFTQQDIDNGLVSYANDGSDASTDQFSFDIQSNNRGWKTNQIFNIQIEESILTIVANITGTINCNGGQTASISIDPQNGTAPYQYSIDGINYQSENSFSGLAEGNYTITVKDNNNNTGATTLTITEPNAIIIDPEVTDNQITVNTSGGTGNYEYQLDSGTFQTNNTFTNLDNATYTITVKDANNCTKSTTATVAVADLVIEVELMKGLSCHNADDAEIEIYASGGIEPYQYSINGIDFQSSNRFSNLNAGNYTVYVKDTRDVMQNNNNLSITNPSKLEADATAVEEQITVEASGGTGSMYYSIDGENFQDNNTFTNLSNGTYTLTIKDENNCLTSTTATVSHNSLAVASEMIQGISCHGGADGKIEVYATGGIAPLKYSLDGENYQESNIFTGLSLNTSYIVTVRDEEGFIKTSNEITFNNPTELSLSTSVEANTIVASASGGTGAYEYSIDGISFQTNNTFTNLDNGDYSIIVKDANGCSVTTTADVFANTLVVSSEIVQLINCHEGADGKIKVEVQGGKEPYQYSIDGENYQSGNGFENLSAGTYTVMVKDADGFTRETNDIVLTNPAAIRADVVVNENTVQIVVSGGTGSFNFSFEGSEFQNDNFFEEVPNGTHQIEIKDTNGCSIAVSATVSFNNLVTNLSIEKEMTCKGTNDAKIIATVSGGTMPYQYSVNDGESYQDENIFSLLAAGTYSVKVKDAEGFTRITNEVNIEEPPIIIVEAAVNGGTITVNASGGTGELFYSLDGNNFQSDNVFKNLAVGDYFITVKDKNNCRGLGLGSVETTTGISDLKNTIPFNLYPNPTMGRFTFELNQIPERDLEIHIFNVKGQLIWRKLIKKNGANVKATFDVSHLTNGVYQLQVNDGKRFGNKRLVILKH